MKKEIAIVILNWNGAKFLEKFLPSTIQHSIDLADIYIADNASTDNSEILIKQTFTQCFWMRSAKNLGFAGGYNFFLDALKGRYSFYVLMNNDIEVTPNWLQPIMEQFNRNKLNAMLLEAQQPIALIQPKILAYNNTNYFEHAGASGGMLDYLAYPFCRGRVLENTEQDKGQYNHAIPCFWASGACCVISAEAFHEANGFDADFFAHQEEIDLNWRLQALGYSVWVEPRSTVFHVGGGSLQYNNPHKTYLNFRNNMAMLLKNLPSNKVWKVFIVRLMLDGIAGAKYMIDLKPMHTLAIAKAHFYIYIHILKILKKRKTQQSQAKREVVLFSKSIIWQYYIKKRKTYQALIEA